jgi:flagellar biosynthesis protein FliR
MTFTLDFLPQTAFAFLLVFARIGAIAMSLPGIGDRRVPSRIRLVFALSMSVVLYPIVIKFFSGFPTSLIGIISAIISEIMVGIAIGFSVRLIISAIELVGTAIAFQTGLAFAQSVDPANGIQSSMFGSFLSVLAVTMIFTTDMHFMLLSAMHDSYLLFKPGNPLPLGDLAQNAIQTLSTGFRIAIQLAGPFLAFGLIFYLGVGVLARLIPQVQVFFLAMPLNILLGIILFMVLLSPILYWFLDYFGEALRPYLA